jgi:hypothetical protein
MKPMCMSVSESRKLSLNVNVKVWDNVEDFMKCEHGGLLCTWNKIEFVLFVMQTYKESILGLVETWNKVESLICVTNLERDHFGLV